MGAQNNERRDLSLSFAGAYASRIAVFRLEAARLLRAVPGAVRYAVPLRCRP